MCPLSNIVSQIFENFNKQMHRKDVDVYIWLLSEYFHAPKLSVDSDKNMENHYHLGMGIVLGSVFVLQA